MIAITDCFWIPNVGGVYCPGQQVELNDVVLEAQIVQQGKAQAA